ncbi:phosphatase PAP2 family protein [Halocella sp. SP3-1]|uniref:phosphatase PAP2 family protein n=1 Tax=Halocella sp. SP3-1 TaxID=2382161 RepID=UPI000F75279C|nr:phosphatase PAP2 family protein [Halocella sp. SP3-1]AZO94272.1 phosphatase PAP2 family protein [Halocella sp. SP3-1]MTI58702.1 phosphatase PAP2 family protein [Bacillota bacterium]
MNSIADKLLIKDVQVFNYLNKRLKNNLVNRLMLFITHLGGAPFTISFTIFFILIKPSFHPYLGWELLLVLASSHLLVHIIKRLINRQRPYVELGNIEILIEPFESYSFPSGHTTASFSIALTLSFYLSFLFPIVILLALLVAISRVYLGVHYPSDVLVGIMIAFIFSFLVHYYVFI